MAIHTDAAPEQLASSESSPTPRSSLARYAVPSPRQSAIQLAVSIASFLFFWAASYLSLGISLALALALALPAAGFMVRLFIIQHDCGHGAFFRTARANSIAG